MKSLVGIIIALVIGFLFGNTTANEEKEMLTMDHESGSMENMMMDMTARMEGKEGDELDKIFLEDMIIHHQGAVDMSVVLLEKTEREELREFAQAIISVQDEEISMMKSWLNEWFEE